MSGDGADEQTVGSQDVNVLDGWTQVWSAPTGGTRTVVKPGERCLGPGYLTELNGAAYCWEPVKIKASGFTLFHARLCPCPRGSELAQRLALAGCPLMLNLTSRPESIRVSAIRGQLSDASWRSSRT
jgi:hypothetical protein